MQVVDLTIDVTDAAGLGEDASLAVTVHLPEVSTLSPRPVVCFAKPGGGYSKGYFTVDLPGPARGAQAEWHASRGWIFVSVDHLGVGASSTAHDPARLDYTTLAATAHAAEQEVLRRLVDGSLSDDFPPVADALLIGIGQSMGGCMTVIQQGRYHGYDGIGVLGYSAVHTHPPVRPGATPVTAPWLPRDTLLDEPLVVVNGPQLASAALVVGAGESGATMAWGFHYDDVDAEITQADLLDFPTREGNVPPWGSATVPGAVGASCLTPGAIAPEAAAVRAPVLIAIGERDVIADPRGELRAYQCASSVDFFICPRMGHMHNFAGTRELFWRRIETWAEWVRVMKESQPR
jgi:alpha-beta hydrolase superfamily lysophospholipase